MTANRDPLLTALNVLIDDHVLLPGQHVIRSGQRYPVRPEKLPDAELVYLAVAQVLLCARGENHRLRKCSAQLRRLLPCLPK